MQWSPSSGAEEYEIIGAYIGPSANPVYSTLGHTRSTSFTDTTVAIWNSYVYRVKARNSSGTTEPSTPAMIRVYPYAEWVNDWFRAPNLPSPHSYEQSDPISNTSGDPGLTTTGGDTGLTTSTQFPESAVYEECSVAGAGLIDVRPALDSIVPDAPQTFAFRVAYNAGSSDLRFRVSAWTSYAPLQERWWPLNHVYSEEKLLRGCGESTITFTVDVGALDANVMHYVSVAKSDGTNVFNDVVGYQTRAGSWVEILTTTPADGTTLSGGELTLTFRYQVDATQDIRFRLTQPVSTTSTLRANIGHAITTVTRGTGTASLTLPYDGLCIGAKASIEVSSLLPTRAIGPSPEFPVSSTDLFQVATEFDPWGYWFRKDGFSSGRITVWPLSCMGPQSVTLTTQPGWGVAQPNQFVSTVTGPSDKPYSFVMNTQAFYSMPYGSHVSYVTATFHGTAVTEPVSFSIYELFWKSWPTASAGEWRLNHAYPYAITIAGPLPNTRLRGLQLSNISSGQSWVESPSFQWDATREVYTSDISFSHCGSYLIHVEGLRYGLTSDVSSADAYSILVDGQSSYTPRLKYIDLSQGDVGPKEMNVKDACGNSFHWVISAAPSWLRFEKLTGSGLEPIRFGVVTDDGAFQSDPYQGAIEIWVPEAQSSVYVLPLIILN